MVSALYTGLGDLVSSPGRGYCVLPLLKTVSPPQCLSPRRCSSDYWRINAAGNPVMDYHSVQGGVEILLVALNTTKKWDNLHFTHKQRS